MRTRFWIAALIFPMVNAILFGIGVVPLLSIDALAEHAGTLFPFVVGGSFLIAAPIAWVIAPRLRLRYGRKPQAA